MNDLLDPKNSLRVQRIGIECAEEWEEWANKIPPLQFDSRWSVLITPPHLGAMVRFKVLHKDKSVSVYLDTMNRLWSMGVAYWEVMTWEALEDNKDPVRFLFEEHGQLMAYIIDHLNGPHIGAIRDIGI